MAAKKQTKKFSDELLKSWEITAWLGIPWEYANKTKGDEREFLLSKASESKLDFLKNQKAETEKREKFESELRERQEQQMAMLMQQQRNQQGFQHPPSFAPPQQAYPYGPPNQVPHPHAMPQAPSAPPPPA